MLRTTLGEQGAYGQAGQFPSPPELAGKPTGPTPHSNPNLIARQRTIRTPRPPWLRSDCPILAAAAQGDKAAVALGHQCSGSSPARTPTASRLRLGAAAVELLKNHGASPNDFETLDGNGGRQIPYMYTAKVTCCWSRQPPPAGLHCAAVAPSFTSDGAERAWEDR